MKNLKWLIDRLSELIGIIPYYYNYLGEQVFTTEETQIEIISSMGIEISENSLNQWIEYFEYSRYENFVEPVYVTENPPKLNIYNEKYKLTSIGIEILPFEELGTKGDKITLEVAIDESGITELPSLPIGYYRLKLYFNETYRESILIVIPHESYLCPDRTWGFHINPWSLRGKGIEGDYSHIREMGEYVKKLGGFISLTPMHFNDPEDIYGISPYSALSRLFKTPIYISDISIPEKNKYFFDYSRVWDEKIRELRVRFNKFYEGLKSQSKESQEFMEYKSSLCPLIREDLEYFASYLFLRERHGKNWQNWDIKYRDIDRQTINELYNIYEKELLFYEYLQWIIDLEIKSLNEAKLCLDIGFGSIESSFDVWRNKDIYAINSEYGAPPDDFNPRGQKWGFPPVIPFKLKEKAYIPFIKILKNNMKGSFLRIDHALGLFRAFWIPKGKSPGEGAYLRYPWKDLLGIICLESTINRCSIIGEDLGTAEEWMREELTKRGIASWKVFYFEKECLSYKELNSYPEKALCSITTHDLPTLRGFWYGKDIELRRKFEIFDDTSFQKALKEREKDRESIINLLKKNGLLANGDEIEKILLSIIRFLSMTKSKYLLLYPEDILLIEEQTNLPGTSTEYPNWQRKLPVTVEEFLNLPILKEIEAILKETGRLPED